jgi:hypothetical protein
VCMCVCIARRMYVCMYVCKSHASINRSQDGLEKCRLGRVTSLYLYNNSLTRLNGLDQTITGLMYLYLQSNRLAKLEGLESLSCLVKLYVGNNELTRIEGLRSMTSLEELHAPDQRSDQPMTFESASISALAVRTYLYMPDT